MSRDQSGANIARIGGSVRDTNRDVGVSFLDDAVFVRNPGARSEEMGSFRREAADPFLAEQFQGHRMTINEVVHRAHEYGANERGRIEREGEEAEEEEEDEEIFVGNEDDSELADDDSGFHSDIELSLDSGLGSAMRRREREGDGNNNRSSPTNSLDVGLELGLETYADLEPTGLAPGFGRLPENPIQQMNVFELTVEDLRRLANGEFTRREREASSFHGPRREDTGTAYIANMDGGRNIRARLRSRFGERYLCECEDARGMGISRRHLPSRRAFLMRILS